MPAPTSSIKPRDLGVDFAAVPRHWLAGSAAATGIVNGLNLLFPAGERFFVRSVKHYVDRLGADAQLRADIKGFFGQEGRHAREHDRMTGVMRDQGYEVDRFLAIYDRWLTRVERAMPPVLRLAVTAASEHFTAIMAEGMFRRTLLDAAAPEMRALLAWHSAEEIEHKAVAFDVLQAVSSSYAVRMAGLALATAMLATFWLAASTTLLHQDGLTWRDALAQLETIPNRSRQPVIKNVFLAGIREYLARDFHPNQRDTAGLVEAWLADRGMTLPEAA